jgi:hypothetical protein
LEEFLDKRLKEAMELYVRIIVGAGGQMGGQWHYTSRGIHILLWKEKGEPGIATPFFVYSRIVSAVKGVGLVSGRMSHITQRG